MEKIVINTGLVAFDAQYKHSLVQKDDVCFEQMQAMMGGYGITRHLIEKDAITASYYYTGMIESLDWFAGIFRMYNFDVTILE